MAWVLLMIVAVGTGPNFQIEARSLQSFETETLCRRADNDITAKMRQLAGQGQAQMGVELMCLQTR